MRILLISPLGFAVNEQTKYAGIERLVWIYARELKRLEHDVSVLGHSDSIYAQGVVHYKTQPEGDIFGLSEAKQYQSYQSILRDFEVIHDFSHQHLASRLNQLPSVNPFWHDPNTARYPKSPYNIVGLSKWACRQFEKVYHQKARYIQSIALDTELYKLSPRHRNDRFLVLGRITPNKGVYETCILCRDLKISLDVVGKGDNDEYDKRVRTLCDGIFMKYYGEVDDETKIKMMQSCKALIYTPNESEVSNHKIQEAMLCGAPIVTFGIGGLPEIITHGVDGFLCQNIKEFDEAIKNIDKLNIKQNYSQNQAKYDIKTVLANYIMLYEQVAKGLRW